MVFPFILYLLISFCLQITYRIMRNLHGVDKLVGKMSINSKSVTCIISIILNVPTLLLMLIVKLLKLYT